jgi:pyruvate,water dikinase
VLVCPSTDPGWTSLFVNARGLIVERGGVLSHGAIVARDFGIPAVVCPGATGRIRDGERVQVDGNRGEIRIVERE